MFQRRSGVRPKRHALPDGEKMPTQADLRKLKQLCSPKKIPWNKTLDLSLRCRNCGEPGLKWMWSEEHKRNVLGKAGVMHDCKVMPLVYKEFDADQH